MTIQVVGTGCPTCKRLHESVQKVARELGLGEVEYVTDIQAMLDMGVMQSPVLAVDGVPVAAGSVPNPFRIRQLLEAARR